ncbi:galactokinase family protein, partial [Brachyspira catarrhinii]
MYKISELKELLTNKKLDDKFDKIYGGDKNSIEEAYLRLSSVLESFQKIEKSDNVQIFSASGRTELSGNHTDHNNGNVLTASINLDKLALISKREDNKIIVYTDGIDNPDSIDINNLEIDKKEYGKSTALIRGVCAGLINSGYKIGGFTAFLNNKVLMGSGLS